MNKRTPLALIVAAVALAGCVGYALVKPERVSIVGDYFTVETPIAWSKIASGKTESWTVDGGSLEELVFIAGVDDGDTLFRVAEAEKARTPTFKKGMTTLDAREFIESSMAARGWQSLAIRDFRVAPFGSLPGFRAELDYATRGGLEKTGFMLGAIHKDRLHLIVYTGARLYFFDKYRNDAEKVAASVVIKS